MISDLPATPGVRFIDMSGKRCGRLLVVKPVEIRHKEYAYECLCNCGNTVIVRGSYLRKKRTQSCGCLQKEVTIKRSLHNTYGYIHGLQGYNGVIRNYKRMAAARGHVWELSDDEAIQLLRANCYYCGSPPKNSLLVNHARLPTIYTGIDRVNNTRGYVTGNVVACCKRCNIAKATMTLQEFKDWVCAVYANITSVPTSSHKEGQERQL